MSSALPITIGKLIPSLSANAFTPSGEPSSNETPTTSKPSLYFFVNSIRNGISSRHGEHQVAQKFKMTTFPGQLAVDTTFSSMSLTRKGGAGWGLLTNRMTVAVLRAGTVSFDAVKRLGRTVLMPIATKII